MPKQNSKAAKVKKRIKAYAPTQDWIPVREIRNGIIETTDGRYVKILEVSPNNFAMRSASEKNDIIYNFAGWLKSAPVRFQIKSVARRAESNRHIAEVAKDLEWEKNRLAELPQQIKDLEAKVESASGNTRFRLSNRLGVLRSEYRSLMDDYSSNAAKTRGRLGYEYINLVRSLSSNEAVARKFYIVLEYDGPKIAGYDEIVTSMRLAEQQARSALSMCDNEILMQKREDEDYFQADVLYQLLNRQLARTESFAGHCDRILGELAKRNPKFGYEDAGKIPVSAFLAPNAVDLCHRNFIYIDHTFYSFLMISQNGYPAKTVNAGWLTRLIDAGDGIDVDIFAEKQNAEKIKTKVNHKFAAHVVKHNDTADTDNSREDVESAMDACAYIKDAIRNKEDVYYMNVLVTVSAKNLKELDTKRRLLVNSLDGDDIDFWGCTWQFEQAFLSSLPLGNLDKGLFESTKRNVTTSGLASTYPFTAYELSDENGILYGINSQNHSLCTVDNFNTRIYKNANMCFLGTSGGGKTFTLQDIALRLRMRNIRDFIIAPLKGHEFRRACHYVGGAFVRICPGSKDCINVLDIRIPDSTSDVEIEGEAAMRTDSLLSKKIQDLKVAFLLLYPDMSLVQEQLLDDALVKTYNDFGITHDNRSLFRNDDSSKLREMPTLADLYDRIKDNDRLEEVAIVLSTLVSGSASSFNGHTNVDLNNGYIVFDISELTQELLPFGMMIVLDFIMSKVKEDRTVKKAVFIDEVWQLIGGRSNKYAAEFVLELFKTIRGYGGAAIAASQDLNDFFSLENGKYGKGILNSSAIKIIKYLEANEAEAVQKAMDLTDNEIRAIRRFDRTQGLFCANSSRVAVEFVATGIEKALITTDSRELAKLKENGSYATLLNSEPAA